IDLAKIRVYEYAKKMNMSSKEILTILKRLNISVNNHMSVLDDEMVKKVEQFFKDVKQGAEKSEPNTAKHEEKTKQKSNNRTGGNRRSEGGKNQGRVGRKGKQDQNRTGADQRRRNRGNGKDNK